MPRTSEQPLTKVTLNLFTSDVLSLKRRYGHGYTEQIRRIVADEGKEHRRHKRTIESILAEDMVDGDEA